MVLNKGEYFWLNTTNIAVLRIRSDPVFLGHPDPDPGKYRIRILYPQKDPWNSNFLFI